MTSGPGNPSQIDAEAADWFARMRGPDAASHRDALEAWRAATPGNDAAYRRLLQRWEQTAFLAASAPARDRDLRRAAVWQHRSGWRYGAVAAGLAAVIGGAVLLERRSADPPSAPLGPIVYGSPIGQLRRIALADGVRITLDGDSRIALTRIGDVQRVSLTKGRARFLLPALSPGRILIGANDAAVTGRSVEFDVGLIGRTARVVSWRGTVEVYRGKVADPGTPPRLIAPGRALILAGRDPLVASDAAPVERAWATGRLVFDRTRLAVAVGMFGRYSGRRIVIGSPEIADMRVTGVFSATDAAAFARAVASMFHLEISRASDGAIMLTTPKKA